MSWAPSNDRDRDRGTDDQCGTILDAPVIFEQSVGLSHSVSLLLSGFNGIAYFLSSLIPIWLIDRIGRVSLAEAGYGSFASVY